MDELTLPPLPEFPEGTVEVDCGPLTGGGRAISIEDGYSADQMRAYAQQAASAAVLQERAKWEQDAVRFRWYFSDKPKGEWLMTYLDGMRTGWKIDEWRAAIDAAIRTAPKES